MLVISFNMSVWHGVFLFFRQSVFNFFLLSLAVTLSNYDPYEIFYLEWILNKGTFWLFYNALAYEYILRILNCLLYFLQHAFLCYRRVVIIV